MKYLLDDKILTEWDEEKNRRNSIKHGLNFETAELVFADRCRVEIFDEMHSVDEERYISFGKVGRTIIVVVHTLRGERNRLISARLATKQERQMYYEYYKKRR